MIDKIIDDIKEVEAKEAKEEKVIEQAPAIEPSLDVEEIEDVKVAVAKSHHFILLSMNNRLLMDRKKQQGFYVEPNTGFCR